MAKSKDSIRLAHNAYMREWRKAHKEKCNIRIIQ